MQQILIKNISLPNWSFKNIENEHYNKLRMSIKKNGQTKNIIVRSLENGGFEVIDGKIVFEIIKQLGLVDYVWCYVYRDIDELEAKLVYLENDYFFETNFVKIAQSVQELNTKITKLDISKFTSYNYNEVCELLLLMEYDFKKFEIEKIDNNFNLF